MDKTELEKMKSADFTKELKEIVSNMDAVRAGNGSDKPVDITLGEVAEGKWGISEEDLMDKIGINPKVDTLENIFTMPDQNVRWVVPEIIRSAITLGMREAPFYPNLIASDQGVSQLSVTMPFINMSDAAPEKVNEAETIPLGTISYGQKSVNLFKIGKGIKITDEVRNYVSLDVVAIFLRDFGIQLGYAMDTLAIDTLLNGNKSDGSESAPVIGVTKAGEYSYRDLLRVWIRASRMGRNFSTLIGDEDTSLDLLDLPEFKNRQSGTTQATLNIKTPVPNQADYFIHGGIPDKQLMLVDKRAAMIKLTAKQLMLESERIVSNQTSAVYASLTTGFSKMYLDATVLLDSSKTFTDNGFPSYFNIDPFFNIPLQ